ncbi:RAD51-associated protein 1 isoform X1 [Ctenopharyngodon idella]|uniref:RAD51-associated protein 1 isoform X1 n=1 Tax=Ctenopharyngodon idella TaxID=7959 RepID=UPI00222E25E8|nr:RAD51-associated protein 1 isoform X1 [Ctenopharyngodon idella]
MDRPSRNRKAVDYSVFQDDDDEDFACEKPPPKKARTAVKDLDSESNRKSTSASPSEVVDLTSSGSRKRTSLGDKLYERDLEAALTLSLLDSSRTQDGELTTKTDDCDASQPVQCSPPVLIHCSADGSHLVGDSHPHPDCPPVLSNCSIDDRSLGLNLISMDASPPSVSKQTEASEKQRKPLKKKDNEDDEDYQLQNTQDSDSDADFTEEEESEDETFMMKKKKVVKQKTEKKALPPVKDNKEKKEKKPTKPSKAISSAPSPTICRSPAAPVSGLKKTPNTPPVSKPALCSSPAGGRLPKWNPPGLVGRSPGASQNGSMKSPGQGLRLGLSRLARVKHLHPNAAVN